MNPRNAKDRQRLADAMRYWDRYLEPWNVSRDVQIETFAQTKEGRELLPEGLDEVYVNLIQMTAMVRATASAFSCPRFRAATYDPKQRSFADRYQAGLNEYVKWIKLDRTLRNVILDSSFGWGVVKTYLGDAPWVISNPLREAGVPQVERVSQRNFLWDASVTELNDSFFLADRYMMVYDDALDCPRFDIESLERLQPLDSIKRDNWHHPDESRAEELVELVDVYFPRERIVATWACDDEFVFLDGEPLCVQEWYGAEDGPYRVLSLVPSPDRLIPVSPTDNIENLFLLFNNLLRKMAFTAMEQKDIFTFEPGSEQEAARMLAARHLDVLSLSNKDRFGFFRFPGVDPSLSSFGFSALEMFKMAAGNFDLKAGTGPASGTATQDMLMNQRVSMVEAEERRRVEEFVSGIGTDVGSLLFDDPNLYIPANQQVEGTDIQVDASWYPPDVMPRPGRSDDFGIELIPYSMEYRAPAAQMTQLNQSVMAAAQAAGAAVPLAQFGIMFDVQRYLEILAEYTNTPELKELFYSQPPQAPAGGSGGEGGASIRPPGTGEYTRRNVSEQTNDGMMQQLMQQGMGQANQPVMQ